MIEAIAFCRSKTAFVLDKVKPVAEKHKDRLTFYDRLDLDLFSDPDKFYPEAYRLSLDLPVSVVRRRYISFLKSIYKLKYDR